MSLVLRSASRPSSSSSSSLLLPLRLLSSRCCHSRIRTFATTRAPSLTSSPSPSATPSATPTPRAIRGTHDSFAPASTHHEHLAHVCRTLAHRYGCSQVRTPVLEPATLFLRSLGDTSDIVTKEMFSFVDHGGVHTILRPEGTAGVVRACLNAGLAAPLAHSPHAAQRLFYIGSMFRRERPQRGRYRQFEQFGVEFMGAACASVLAEWDLLSMAHTLLDELHVLPYVQLHLNSLGDAPSRQHYAEQLHAFFAPRLTFLSADSQARFERGNVLRILDSKDARDQAIIRGELDPATLDALTAHLSNAGIPAEQTAALARARAPLLHDSLNASSKSRFDEVKRGLDLLNIPYHVNPFLVRGLDYYSHTAFEFVLTPPSPATTSSSSTPPPLSADLTSFLESRSAVLAGGRYDGLFEQLGGPSVPAIGWAAGIDRLQILRELCGMSAPPSSAPLIAVLAVHEENVAAASSPARDHACALIHRLRRRRFHVLHHLDQSKLSKQMTLAVKQNAQIAVIVGEDELRSGTVQVKLLSEKQQVSMRESELEEFLSRRHAAQK